MRVFKSLLMVGAIVPFMAAHGTASAQTGTLSFNGVKTGKCQSVRVFGKDAAGGFLFISADLPKKAAEYAVSPLASKALPAGKTVIEKVECFDRKNRNLYATPKPGNEFLSDPYVGLKAPLAEINLAAGETVYLGALELHKLGWGAGLITHDLSGDYAPTARKDLLTVTFDEAASLGAANDTAAINDALGDMADSAIAAQTPAPSDKGKGRVGLHFQAEGLDCRKAAVTFGRKSGNGYKADKTVKLDLREASTAFGAFEDKKVKSGRKHLLDVQCITQDGTFGLTPMTNYGSPQFGWSSQGQFDLMPDGNAYIGAVKLIAKPMDGVSKEMSLKLGFMQVQLETTDGSDAVPATFGGFSYQKLDASVQRLESMANSAEFDSKGASQFQTDLKAFLALRGQRRAAMKL